MDEKVYGYMDWPRIEAIVYGEETAPRDVMGPRITQDGEFHNYGLQFQNYLI